jgi:pimeloyl-ACP methyl ester carboxylesterase
MFDPTLGLEDVEARVFERYGLDVRTRLLKLRTPPLRIQVDEVGSGPSVLIVGGGGTGGAAWAGLMARMPGVRLLAVSRPGVGRSDTFDYRGVDLRRHAVALLEGVMDELALDRAPLVANSIGGLWSLWLALDRPDRVSALAQLGCPALLTRTSAPLSMRLLSLPRLGRFVPSPVGRSVTDSLTNAFSAKRLPTEMIDYLRRAERLWARGTTRISLIQSTLRLRGPRRSLQPRDEELAKVGQPVLFIWGDRDAYGPPTVGHHAVSMMPNATIEVLPGGHLPWLEHPDRCAQLVQEFLAHSLIPPPITASTVRRDS